MRVGVRGIILKCWRRKTSSVNLNDQMTECNSVLEFGHFLCSELILHLLIQFELLLHISSGIWKVG